MSRLRLSPLNRRVAGQFLLALLVLVSSLAWTMPTVQAAPQPEAVAAPRVTAWIVGTRLYVSATGLPHNRTFSIRARRTAGDSWTKLARAQSDTQGLLAKSVRLPQYMARYDRLQVCLKDVRSSRIYCTRARRRY